MTQETFAPSVLLPDGRTYEPTGVEWLLAFALAGHQWAIDALPEKLESVDTVWGRMPVGHLFGDHGNLR
jgi:hypothetical protein